jgi:SNF family Na+-dependent transporter
MSEAMHCDVADVVKSGMCRTLRSVSTWGCCLGVGLAFITYPEVVSILPLKQVWALLLFLVLCILGTDTQVGS